MESVTLDTYNGSFKAPKEWLKENINDMNLDDFLNSYTWDESEWLYTLFSMEKEEKEIKQLIRKLQKGISLFKKGEQEGILHACSYKYYTYQFSYFDEYGPIGDIRKNTLGEMAKSIYEYGFTPCTKEYLQIIK